MTNDKMTQLGARLLGEKTTDLDSDLNSVSRIIPVSDTYRDFLIAFGGAVVFDNGAKFTTDEPSPLNDKDGYQSLEVLYGLGSGDHSIKQQAARYTGEVPTSMIPIGEVPGGNLVCVDENGAVFLWDHESPRNGELWRVAASIDEFFDRLQPDDAGIGNTDGIIESESFLDF